MNERKAEPDGLADLRELIGQLKIVRDEVHSLLRGSRVFWEVQEILDANAAALRHRLFNDWMMINYFVATAIGIRRQLDGDPRSVSLRNLLAKIDEAIQRAPDILSRPAFISNFPCELAPNADAQFDKLIAVGATRVEPSYVRKDLEQLEEVARKISYYVNKRIAHRDTEDVQRRSLGELDDALSLLVGTTDRYCRLLTGSGSGISPDLPFNWKSVFKVPWIEK